MEQGKGTTASRKGKHLNYTERILIEKLLKAGLNKTQIARQLDRDYSTIRREIERGMVKHVHSDLSASMAYNADRAQDVHDLNATAKGTAVKLMSGSAAVAFIAYYVGKKGWSPEVVAARMKAKGMPDALSRKYPNACREIGWQYVFPAKNRSRDPRSGKTMRHHVLESGLQKAVKTAVRKAGITKRVGCHTLRHSYALRICSKTGRTSVSCRNLWGIRM